MSTLKRLWKNYSLSMTLAALWLLSWAIQTTAGWAEFASEQREHGLSAELGAYFWVWLRTTFENNSSEFLQLFTMVILTAYLTHRGSGEGKQQQDQADAALAILRSVESEQRRILRHLSRTEQDGVNRRLLERELADHDFQPEIPGDTSAHGGCAVEGCVLPRRQHRLGAGATVLGTVELGELGRIVVRDEGGKEVYVSWETR